MTLEQAKTGVALVGMAIAVTGVALGSRPLVWVAIAVLGGAMVLRFVANRSRSAPTDQSEVP